MPLTWLGVVIVVGALAILIYEPIQVPKQHWIMLGNYLLSLAVSVPGAILIGLQLGKLLKKTG